MLGNSPDSYFVAADNSGPPSWDTPHRTVTWAYLPGPSASRSVSHMIEHRTGFVTAADSAGFVVTPNSRRFPDYFDLTLGLERRTYLLRQAQPRASATSPITRT